ncbi:MAG TPA: hypothetical protein VHY35_04655 [Stellaceae bacterium]|jgi:hypothetical protein|nr:hypothetical protein [Stellaceae bacterium]
MARRKNKGGDAADAKKGVAFRPILLAAGLGLLWFVEFPQAGAPADDAPAWAFAALTGGRLLADFVGGWVFVSLLRLAFAIQRYAIARVRSGPAEETT